MGRANRLLAGHASVIAMGFGHAAKGDKVVVTGNPVRPPVLAAAQQAYGARHAGEPFNLLVFGGSQGAQFFSQVLPQALALMPPVQRKLLSIVQQARPEDDAPLRQAYAGIGIAAEIAPFFTDMAQRIANAHFVISRAGASTVSELSVIGRPALLVPYPHALDHDQAMNARTLAENGGARIVEQGELSPQRLATLLGKAIAEPLGLAETAEKAKRSGIADAASRLADCVERVMTA
jgi:UDP-N-acetylglucosamine--N-acetylmuramyl-(pentapeptide) pyrophosphoryl-undecaprenol N-acetylglucosamine transferase